MVSSVTAVDKVDVQRDPRLGQLREVTGQVVGSVFFGTLLKTMRESPLRGSIGHGGRAEEVFASQLDAELASRAGLASRNDLTDTLFKHLARQQLSLDEARSAASGNNNEAASIESSAGTSASAWLERLRARPEAMVDLGRTNESLR
ncbi:MAG: hypothetical protein GY842_08710 [bacterium]|nr:hypothetical protein [bacterium]